MLHLSPKSGKWISCSAGDDGKCPLLYHAPFEEGEVAESLLWETYAAEELYKEPSHISVRRYTWLNAEGHRHREYDLPAVEYSDGAKVWYQDGKLHRTDGPAVETAYGHREWRVSGKLHRVDGPAIEYSDGYVEWWVDGERC